MGQAVILSGLAGQSAIRSSVGDDVRLDWRSRILRAIGIMTFVGIAVLLLCIYLAFKVAGFMFKMALWVVVIAVIYWLAAPYLGMPVLF